MNKLVDSPIVSWGRFNYALMKRTSWLSRRVESWSYTGDARWRRSFSLDLDLLQLDIIYCSDYLGLACDSEECTNFIDNPQREYLVPFFNLPLFEVSKTEQFADFDVRDSAGRPMHLVSRSESAQIVLNTLLGAIYTEHGECLKNGNLPPLILDGPLLRFLFELFSSTVPPNDRNGNRILPDSDRCLERLVDSCYTTLEEKKHSGASAGDPEWSDEEASLAKWKLREYSTKSLVFQYFLKTYALKWLAYVPVSFNDSSGSIIKGSYHVVKDSLSQNGRLPLLTNLFHPLSRGIPFDLDLDCIGTSEVEHITVTSPDGTFFSPSKYERNRETFHSRNPFCNTNRSQHSELIANDEKKFYILDDQSAAITNDRQKKSEADFWGLLTPGHATLEARKAWSRNRPKRRLPVDGSSEHRYYLCLTISPRLGLRSVGYSAFLAMSLLAFFLCAINPEVYTASSSDFSLGSILVLASIIVMIVANRNEESSFVRRMCFTLPRWLSYTCLIVDIVGFICFLLCGFESTAPLSFQHLSSLAEFAKAHAPLVALSGTIICGISLALCLTWIANFSFRKWHWTRKKHAYEVFEVESVLRH